ncbi:hypothetical protein WDW37_15055 [Bdellovibrionota bacterium FG-1]
MRALRLQNIQAVLKFEDAEYPVLNISATGVLIGGGADRGEWGPIDEAVVRKMSAGVFQFALLDSNGSEMGFEGKLVRASVGSEIAIVFGNEA